MDTTEESKIAGNRYFLKRPVGRTVGRILLIAMILAAFTLSAFCLVIAIRWIKKPFAGFLVNQRMIVGNLAEDSWTGIQAGLRFPDKILKADGQAISSIREFQRFMSKARIGDPIRYSVERDGKTLDVVVPVMKFTWIDLLKLFWIPYLCGIIYILLGFIVFLMKPDSRESLAFLCASFLLGIYYVLSFDMLSTHVGLVRVYLFAYTFLPAAAIHLGLVFPKKREWVERNRYLQTLPYLLSTILFIPLEYYYPGPKFAAICYPSMPAYLAVGALAMMGSTLHAYLQKSSVAARLRAKVVLMGAALAFPVPLVADLSSFFSRIATNTLAIITVLIFPASIAYAIAKHDLFAIDIIVRRTAGYVLSTATIVGAYALLVSGLDVTFQSSEVAASPAFSLSFILLVVFVFNPLRNRMQMFIDRLFYRLEYDYRETVQRISETMRSLLNLDQILEAMMDAALGVMFIDSGCILLMDRERTAYECAIARGEREERRQQTEPAGGSPSKGGDAGVPVEEANPAISDGESEARDREESPLSGLRLSAGEPLLQRIASRKKEVTVYDVQEDPFFEDGRESCLKAFERMQATLIVPLIYEDRLTGLISLGEKKSGKFYQEEDVAFFRTLANQSAVAIENARLLEEVIEKERMEEELAIARDLQMSMLPTACPELEGFEIAAVSIPAREVGGDFFDFIDMEEGRLGLVIGDVTGKSVSGALVMSASRTVFRMLSEEQLSVGEIMARANRRLKKDVSSGMFVALLYAVLDARNSSLSLCSAGQTQPVHLVGKTGQVRLLETVGDTFPLGILPEADYQETRLDLEPGDKVVFYTDGIVEAMNERQEIFGFDRLLDLIAEAQSMDSDSLMKEILYRVKEFAGSAPQHDDLTIISLEVAH